ncbi:hypothetical protein BUL40_08345 [Croceivirga radicis]|uniref:BioF2-like acetyltransferase domain-containing protein n=1 Tax=Croceivirga radicis TaxID=1929488 RepID=A0A1V6LSK2_9FLAO|nr:GNAT family N-acetyltransferase [Croceivirga radicis]OQD43089.1 hypothetical protein BUL40_08345 [Croceivirga radicis]
MEVGTAVIEHLQVIKLTNTTAIKEYKRALKSIACDSPYYCFELLNNSQDEEQTLCAAIYRNTAMEIMAVMPFFLRKIKKTTYFDVTSPWGYNGPFFNKEFGKEQQRLFWKQLHCWYERNNIISEFLRFNFYGNHKYYDGDVVHTLFNVQGNITDWDAFWSGQKPNTRNQFRKAEKLGLKFELHYKTIPAEKIADFYQVYIGTMDRRSAVDSFYHTLEYFKAICANNTEKCAIGLVYDETGEPISTEFFLVSQDTLFSFLGGTDSNHFKKRPNEYLKISAIKWAGENGLTFYMIGGGLSNSKEDNLYLYKKKYFPHHPDIDFYTGRKIINKEVYTLLLQQVGVVNAASFIDKNGTSGFFPAYRQKV